jgi:Holliday junction resolvase RusA-like endonuclease
MTTYRGAIFPSNKNDLLPWSKKVYETARQAADRAGLRRLFRDCSVEIIFVMQRTRKSDIDKLARAILDALKGAVIIDDVYVNELRLKKVQGGEENQGAIIIVSENEGPSKFQIASQVIDDDSVE